MTIGIIDYGVGNLGSLAGALEVIKVPYMLIKEPVHLDQVQKIILPGVGSFTHCKNLLDMHGWSKEILIQVDSGKSLLGICVGMQLLASIGFEGALSPSGTPGLGLIPGSIRVMSDAGVALRLPHVGWNNIEVVKNSPLFEGINSEADFYFIHSYAYTLNNQDDLLASSSYGVSFPAVISRGNVVGTQFHPEKSSKVGLKLLENFSKFHHVKN